MKKSLIPAILACAMMYSCSNDEVLEQRQPQAITYAPTVTIPTRGVTTTANIDQYVVDGFLTTDKETTHYVNNNAFNLVEGQWKTDNSHYWPYTGTINFYALSPNSLRAKADFGVENTTDRTVAIKDYEISTTVGAYTDVLYSVTTDQSHANGSDLAPVPLDFKHALSQVVFNVKNTNSALIIDVKGIRIANLASKGTYTLPNSTTTLQAGSPVGAWTLAPKANGGKTYDAFVSEVKDITPEKGVVALTTPENGAMLLLPQTATAWDPQNDGDNVAGGSFILVNCHVWTVAGENKTLLWPNVTDTSGEIIYREIAIPLALNWEQGKKYTYTLVFGNGAGYIPPTDTEGGSAVDLGGDAVLKPITYSVQVDDFTATTEQEVQSNK